MKAAMAAANKFGKRGLTPLGIAGLGLPLLRLLNRAVNRCLLTMSHEVRYPANDRQYGQ
jgi:hypothetical protein